MNTLVIYDATGKIWSIAQGVSLERPEGLPSVFVNIPDGSVLDHIDVSDPENPKAVFSHTSSMVSQIEQIENLTKAMTFAAVTFTDEQALQVRDLYQNWEDIEDGAFLDAGLRLNYKENLYKVNEPGHEKQESWTPDTAHSLFTPVGAPDAGTKENPIAWVDGMESEKDLYYIDGGILYLCIESSGNGLYAKPKDLPRYFQVVEDADPEQGYAQGREEKE